MADRICGKLCIAGDALIYTHEAMGMRKAQGGVHPAVACVREVLRNPPESLPERCAALVPAGPDLLVWQASSGICHGAPSCLQGGST